MNDSFGLMLLSASKTIQAPLATTVRPFSTYLIGLCITLQKKLELRSEMSEA